MQGTTIDDDLTFTEGQDSKSHISTLIGGISFGESDYDEGDVGQGKEVKEDKAYRDMKSSQAYYLGVGIKPGMSRSASEGRRNSPPSTPQSRTLDVTGRHSSSEWGSERMGFVKNDTNSMKIDRSSVGWGFAARLQKVQKSTKGAIKGMRRRSKTVDA